MLNAKGKFEMERAQMLKEQKSREQTEKDVILNKSKFARAPIKFAIGKLG